HLDLDGALMGHFVYRALAGAMARSGRGDDRRVGVVLATVIAVAVAAVAVAVAAVAVAVAAVAVAVAVAVGALTRGARLVAPHGHHDIILIRPGRRRVVSLRLRMGLVVVARGRLLAAVDHLREGVPETGADVLAAGLARQRAPV